MPQPVHALTLRGRTLHWGKRTYVMGVINTTPDSFSGDGVGDDVDAAVAQGLRFVQEGADIIDVGGESTRPPAAAAQEARLRGVSPTGPLGASPVSVDEELRRVIPVIEGLVKAVKVPISVDTYKSEVARQAVAAGASIVNDVWGLQTDPAIAAVAASTGAALVLMHNQRGHEYRDLLGDILDSLTQSALKAQAAGVPRERIILDPGIGFGKVAEQSLEVLRRLDEIKDLGYPVLVGASRKSSIGAVLKLPVAERIEGTAATVAVAIAKGADIVRVHDVKEMARVARMTDAIVRGWTGWKDV